ncbi:hypothetical protein AVT10_16985 [Sphingomonas hankookensis]|jgi:hypothetical protein|uniref:DUF6916 domain-containing protein n=1 Tax=Sphingomonas hankookensis TaxID=563996 RepID=A0ABR5YBI3_9SPHN|nr:hypothetical protein [Sphingomonas hankookensis]KZE11869.1 hypothetical protein AVT10_16985 [Sphingomonas hankookensis]PZT91046.1 MAG: hypothetical protein DI625_16390 [Sphingomonas sp.]RSV29027.1 hypothetical protein CA237_09580 [Sphingomonas sp. ABOLH]WCP70915.1 hypothetical protein PPZ50_11065 [Sphingomonas hankookensis]
MHLMTPEDFLPWVGRTVKVNTLPQSVEVRLDRVETSPRLPAGLDFRQPFSLVFEAPLNVVLLDLAYEFDCGRGGPYSIFISQRPPLRDRRIYQAVFN